MVYFWHTHGCRISHCSRPSRCCRSYTLAACFNALPNHASDIELPELQIESTQDRCIYIPFCFWVDIFQIFFCLFNHFLLRINSDIWCYKVMASLNLQYFVACDELQHCVCRKTLADLPLPVMSNVLMHLDAQNVHQLGRSCRFFRSLAEESVPDLNLSLYPHQARIASGSSAILQVCTMTSP